MIRPAVAALAFWLWTCAACAATAHAALDWRDQVVYFVMIDRFDDADPTNDDQGDGEYDPTRPSHYSGGDLAGVTRRVGYIRALGATAVWITPPVANRWWDAAAGYGGYHGYWALDFDAVDAHYGTKRDYRALARALHGAGLYLIQDIVVNHTANGFRYPGAWDPADPTVGYTPNPDRRGRSAPIRAPFAWNDPRDPQQRAAGVYHWTPAIRDAGDRTQELTWQLADLDDLDTRNPRVRAALRASYGRWIRDVGVDAFRVDTAFYVEPAFFADFLRSTDPAAPGVLRVAAAAGRERFHVFGEGFGVDAPFEDAQARKIESYMRAADGTPLLPGMLNFPLYGTALDVFARGRATAALRHRIDSMMRLHARPHLMPTFVDNHDVDRFLTTGSEAALRQALLAILTLPGIPTIYYGTEQGFTEQRGAMFARGFASGGRDRFDTGAPLFRYLRDAIALRRAHRVLSRGAPTVLADDATGPGAFAYRMSGGDADGAPLVVLFNTADEPILLDAEDATLAGRTLRGLFGIDGRPADLAVGADGRFARVLPPRAGLVFAAAEAARDAAPASAALTIDPLPAAPVTDTLTVSGRARGVGALELVVDGRVGRSVRVVPDADGRWRATLDVSDCTDAGVPHRLVATGAGARVLSAPATFRVDPRWRLLADVADPAADDRGPTGAYRYPSDPSWGEHRQGDVRRVRVSGAGRALKLELTMHDVTTSWNPAFGFDHVAFTLFVELPGRDGTAVMPLQNATLPDGMRWTRRVRAHGWSNALFASDGASATTEGRNVVPGAALAVDRAAKTVTFVLPPAALGATTLEGARVYVTTWDWDGGYRALAPSPSGHVFGGGDGARDPLWLDAVGPIVLPRFTSPRDGT